MRIVERCDGFYWQAPGDGAPEPGETVGDTTTDLNAASRAQMGRDEETRPPRPREDDASIEDPLGDWPEGSGRD